MPAGSPPRSGCRSTRLVVATNENDILARFFATGRYERGTVVATTSPSMDIQVASNFERLLLELEGGDAERTRARMQAFAQAGGFALDGELPGLFAGGSADQAEVAATIAATLRAHGRAGRSAHRRRPGRRRPPPAAAGRAAGDAGDRPPRQVPRRGRGRDRRRARRCRRATPT